MFLSRRKFIALAASFGASVAWRSAYPHESKIQRRERRDLFPQGVASGDPHPDSVILWTRREPIAGSEAKTLIVEIADDPEFHHVVSTAKATLAAKADWTCRVLAAGLKPRNIYWYRFTDEHGFGSRIGRTITAPSKKDSRSVSFAFVSCQNLQMGGSNAYRRMIWEDEQKAVADQLGFVLHLGDFVYEVVWYPEDRPGGYYARKLYDVVRYPNGEKMKDFHLPTTVTDYRALYRGYLSDADLQDARARWPFVYIWDNHEFSWTGWQSQQDYGGVRPAQTRKVAANQAWFEYQPARVVKIDPAVDIFTAPAVNDAPLREFDDHGLGLEPGNLAAINSLKLYRTLRWGRNVELILTDNRSFRSEPVMYGSAAAQFQPADFPYVFPENVIDILDGGRAHNSGNPPDTIRFNGADVPNPRKHALPQSMLGATQKAWFLRTLHASRATWKLWGNSVGMLDCRLDFQNLPAELGPKWPTAGYGNLVGDDWSAYRHERSEILNFIRNHRITGVAAIAGDRHAFEAGVVSPSLPPNVFEPVMAEFITGSISAAGLFEKAEYSLPRDHPLHAVYLYRPSKGEPGETIRPAINFSLMHGVRAGLALQRTGDTRQALAERNPELAPHLSFVDLGGHGYSVVRAVADQLEVEFVCIPRPLERTLQKDGGPADGGPLVYRITHRVNRWSVGGKPVMERGKVEGELPH